METPEVRYVITDDDVRVAYQDFGSGPPVVFSQNVFGHLEAYWEFNSLRRVFERLASNLRVLMFDHRGAGMSDGFVKAPLIDDRMLDIKAVMDAVGVEETSLIGFDVGGQVAIGFAALHPQRVDRLTVVNARVGASTESRAAELNLGAEQPHPAGGSGIVPANIDKIGIEVDETLAYFSPSVANLEDELQSSPRFQARVGSRDAYKRQIESLDRLDVTDFAPMVMAPTLVAHAKGNRFVHIGFARVLAELIPDSTLLEVDGDDHIPWIAGNWKDIVDSLIGFITQSDVEAPLSRRFAVVIFTDIVGSTEASVMSGDDEWRQRLDIHDRITNRTVHRHDGSIIKGTGDGILAVFDTPSQAVDSAFRLREELSASNISIRVGIHAGEIEIRGDDISGAVVNLASRVEQAARDGEIYTTSTIRDMLIGSTHRFESVGSHQFKGFAEPWSLHRLTSI